MAVLHQFDYILAFGIIFAFLDAWNIGANDVANSFATSVSSRSLTMKQAMILATFCEFGGAVLAGSRVADTIRSKIISVSAFEDNPSVLMLGMLCALVGSSLYLTVATKLGLPVSTTHSIVGGVIGVGVAALGAQNGIQWGWNGVAQIFAAWFIAPALAGIFAVIIFLITKFAVLKRSNPLIAGLWMIPVYFFFTAGILCMVIVWKGAASLNLDDWSTGQTLGCIFGVAGGVVLMYAIFLLPFLHRRLVLEDWTLKSWEVIKGPLLWARGEVPPLPEGQAPVIVQDYYRGHHKAGHDEAAHATATTTTATHPTDQPADIEKIAAKEGVSTPESASTNGGTTSPPAHTSAIPNRLAAFEHPILSVPGFFGRAKYYFFRGVDRDVVSEQTQKDAGFLAAWFTKDLEKKHAYSEEFDNKTEHLYSFLQVMTAMTASFAHGANDVSNAIGPLAAIFLIWNTGETGSKSPVPIWILIFGGAAISIGLWTYGYNLIRNLGNRLTLMSPARGFSMELGAATTVVLATQVGIPISTTQCITGATVGVGLCSGTWRAVNWRMVIWIYMGWFITLPCTGILAGGLMGIILNAPRWGLVPGIDI